MRSIVIGGCGFIGAAVVNVLLDNGDTVKVMDLTGSQERCNEMFSEPVEYSRCNILDYDALANEFKGYDEIYNLAGMLGTSELDRRIVDAVKVNIVGALNVFDAAIACGVPKVFYPSKPNVWLNTYTITKMASEQFACLYNSYGKIKVSSLRFFNVYGPGQHLFPIRKMVPVFALYAMNKKPIEIFGTGEQTVDMIYVDDVAELAVRCTREGVTEIIDCGRGIPVTVNEVAEDVNMWFRNKAKNKYMPMRDGETLDTKLVANVDRLRELFPDFEFSEYRKTLNSTMLHYKMLGDEDIQAAGKFYGLE